MGAERFDFLDEFLGSRHCGRLAQSGEKRYSTRVGFYLELNRDPKSSEYREDFVPFVYLGLVGFSFLALLGMGLAAHTLLAQLASRGSSFWDKFLVYSPLACLPVLLLLGIKLAGMRKFLRFDGNTLTRGFRLWGRPVLVTKLARQEIAELLLENHRPKSNLAPRHHDNPAYYVRGHWRLMAKTKNGATICLDRHTEREALIPLYEDSSTWLLGPQPI